MKTLTKKLQEEIFVWHANAFGGKGYWFVLGKNGGYGKAASKKEADMLGKPEVPKETAKQETATISPVSNNIKEVPALETPEPPVTNVIKEVSNYTADDTRKTKLSDLITKKIIEGGNIGSSIKAGITEKAKARVTGIKEVFDPLNIAKKLTGGLGAAILGRATGRKQEDIEHFTGVSPKNTTTKMYSSSTKVPEQKSDETNIDVKSTLKNINTAMHTKVSEGQKQKVLKGDSAANVLGKLYNLMKQYHDEDITRMELERSNKKFKEERDQKWHEEIIDALLGKGKGKAKKQKPTANKEEGFNLWSYLKNALKSAFEFIVKTIKSIFKGIVNGFKNIVKATVNVFKKFIEGPIKALKTLVVDAFKKLKDFVAPIIKSAREALEFIGKNFASLARKVGLTSLAEKVVSVIAKTEEKTIEKVGAETAEKTLAESTEKAGEKVIEKAAIEETEKIAEKTAGKTLLKKIPFLGALAGLAFGAQRAIGGDLTGAALEVASGVVGSVPVVGTAAGIGIDAYLAARDFGIVGGENKTQPTATPVTEEPESKTYSESEGFNDPEPKKQTPTASPTPAPSTPNQTNSTQSRTGVDLSNKGQRPTMVNDVRTNLVSPTEPESNPLGERVQNAISKNNDMRMEQNIAAKTTVIDNSKNITAGGGSTTEDITTSAIPVRNDEDTWMKLQRLNYRAV